LQRIPNFPPACNANSRSQRWPRLEELQIGCIGAIDRDGNAVSGAVQQAKTPAFSPIFKARVQFQPDPGRASEQK
jgi:hypothetical protein